MCKPVRKLTVIRKDEQPLGVSIETANVEQALGPVLDVVTDTRPSTIINHRRNDTARLIEGDHGDVGHRRHSLAINAYYGRERVNSHALLDNDRAVHFDPALLDELLAPAAAPDASKGKHLLQSNPLIGCHDVPTQSPMATESRTSSSSARLGR
jgi:hypothetical protein